MIPPGPRSGQAGPCMDGTAAQSGETFLVGGKDAK